VIINRAVQPLPRLEASSPPPVAARVPPCRAETPNNVSYTPNMNFTQIDPWRGHPSRFKQGPFVPPAIGGSGSPRPRLSQPCLHSFTVAPGVEPRWDSLSRTETRPRRHLQLCKIV